VILIRGIFEAHLTVSNLPRAMEFYGNTLGLELATHLPDRRVAFYWVGAKGQAMLGLWEGNGPQQLTLHVAFCVDLTDVLDAPSRLRAMGIEPLDFDGNPTTQPVVLAWMPAAAIYFRDPDGNLLEFLAMLPNTPQPERGIVRWDQWTEKL
jgi:lactoylglutathione lyase